MAPLGLLIFAFSAFLFRGVESQPMSCFVQNPCTGTPETTTHEDCCSLERLSGIPENCGERADDACNIYYRVSGEPCDPCQIIGFENSTITLTESGPQTIPIKLFSLGLIEIILLTASITSTNATENVDYSFTSQMFDYLRRVPSDTDIDIDIINDNIALEPIEVIDISLINRGFIDIFGPHDTTIIIIDDDVLTIAANPSFFEVQEGGSISFTLSKDKETAVPVDITVTPLTYQQYSNKTATNNNLPSLSSITNAPSNPAEEQDFNSTAIQLRTGNSSGSFPVSMNGLVTDDTIVEDPEGFVLLIESTNPDPRIRFNNQIIVIQINNDDTLSLMFDQSTLRLSENGGSLSLSILPEAGVMSELTNTVINYQVTPSLAGDVTFLPANSLVFDGTSAVLRITPIDDQTLEDIKTAIITFQPASNESGIQFSPTNSVNVIITDDENVILSLISDSTFVSEGSSFNVCVSVTEPNDVAPHVIPVSLTLIPYLPTQEGDYSTMDSNLSPILTQRNRSTCFLIDTDEDQMTEEDEMFGVSIALQSVAEADFFRSRTSFNPPVLNLTIINDDSVTIGFRMESISVVEGSNPVSICFRVLNEETLARNVAVNVSSSSNTAVIGVDYNLPSSVFIFNSSVNEHCVSFVPLEDDIIENTETVTVVLSTSDPAVNFDISRETVSITDNDRASIDFSQAEFTIREDGSTLSYSVILTGNLDRSIVVSVNDIPGTATRDVDYSNVSETITFTNSSKRFTGALRIINDSIVETTETLILALSSSDPSVDLVNATVSIADVSNVSIGFTMESISVVEGSNPVSICVKVNEGILARNVAVNVSSSSNTAVIGVDYSLPSSVFIFNSSVNEHCVSFVPLEDDIIENTETVAVLLSTSDPAVNFDISRETVSITDNDRASISFSQASFTANEDGSTLSYSVILTGNLDRSIVVSVNDIPGTATRDVDYSNVSETITFTNSSKRFTGVLRIINDSIVETTETLILALSSSDPFVDLVNATVSIADSATSRVNFGFPVLSIPVNESDQTLVVCVDRFSGQIESPREVTVLLSTVDGTARGGSDYISISMVQLVFNSTVMSKCADINIRQDSLYEIDEFFNAIISSNDVAAHFINNVSTITIQDNDMLAIATSLPSNTINVLESNGTVQFCFNVSNGAIDSTSTAVTIDVTATSLGATEGVDYSAMNRSFTFTSDSMTHCYSFNVTDDQNVENEERFQLALSSSSPRVTAPTITVNIIDDDGITLNFESVPPVSEEAQFVTVCVRAQNSQFLQRSVEVLLNTIEGSAAELNDFLPLNNVPLTISPEIGVNCTNITLQGDDGVEGTETFSVRMSSTSNSVSFGDDLRIQLIDDDVATVRLIGPTDAVSEGGGSFDARVEVIGKLEIPITLSLSTLDGTALAGEDFNGVVNASIMLSGTSSSQNVPITIREDDLVEGEESFTISLSLRPVEGANINLSPGTVAVMISDNDDVTIGFLMTSLSVEEGSSPVSICFRVNEGILARNVAVNVSSSSNTAVIGVDYNLPSSVFIFNSSVNEHCVSFVPLEDDIIENTETVAVLLSTSDSAVNFDISRETVSIIDNDRASIGFSQASFTASEDGSTLSYSVILTGNLDRSIVVSVNDIPGTATRDVDYSNVSETITFTNSSKRFTGVLRIINDSIVETTETLILALSSSDPFVDLVNATVSISDSASSRVTVGFLPNPLSLIEGAGVIVSLRVIEGTLARNMSLNMTIVPSTSSDFNIVPDLSESAFIFNGLRYQLLIGTFADDILEGNEEVLVSVSSTDPAFISDGPLRVTIEDANRVRVEFSQTSLSLSEDAGTVSVCASLILVGNTRELAIPVSADAVVVNETAFEFLDFTFDSKVFSFSTNSLTSCVNMSIIKDTIIESAERFSLTLRTSTPGALIEENTVMNITLIEDDVAVFEFTRPSYAVNEGESVEICVGLSNNVAIQNDVSIIVSSEGIEATDGVDYPVVNQTLLYRQGGPDPCFNISPISDSRFESAMERFRLRMRSSSPLVAASDTAIVAITDTDVMGLIFPTGTQEVSEGEMVLVCVTPNITIDISFTVPVNATGITATYPSDFTPQQLSIAVQPFSSGMPQFCSSLSIIDDPEAEQDETIALALAPMPSSRIVPAQSSMYTLIIKDNDEFGVTCNINSTQWVSTFNGTSRYLFDRNCEHKLVSSCNSSRIDIRVDFLNRTLSSGLIAIMHDEQKIVFSAYSVISRPAPSVSNISIIQQVDSVTVTLNSVGLSVNFSKNAVTVVVFGNALMMRLNGLCGALNGDLVYSDCQRTANFMNRTSVSEFITSHFVEAPEQLARPNREECGIIRNDTAQGDPLFTVPILYTRVANLTGPLHLCYEIHGKPDAYFNYISDDCTSVTAHYVQSTNAPIYNIIDSISIVAIDSADHCHQIQVNSNGCTATYDGVSITRNSPGPGSNDIRSPFNHRGISIRRYSDRVRIKVSNCADVSLVMWVVCETVNISDPYTGVNLGPVTMIKFIISRGFNLHEYSHGLIGQFWNIPINVSSFNGVSTYLPRFNDLLYTVSINHPVDPQRQFVGLLYRSWTQRGTSCLHVGNKQAGKIREIESPNDPVIRGTYTDYEVSGPFDTQFVYSVFKRSDSC